MDLRLVRRLTALFFVAYTLALTWPGMLPFNRIRPLILGLPAVLFWVAAWVAAAILVLWLLDRAETSSRRDG